MAGIPEEPDEEPALTNTLGAEQIYPVEGSSTNDAFSAIDESSNDSTASKTSRRPDAPVQCDKCSITGALILYKTKERPAPEKPLIIYRNYCNKCECFFGLCCKKHRQAYYYVTEEGRSLTSAQRSEIVAAEKRKTLSRSNSGESSKKEEELPSSSETSADVDSGEKDEDEGIDEKMEEDIYGENQETLKATQLKVPMVRKKSKKHVFAGKGRKTTWTTSRKKNQRRSASGKFLSDEKNTDDYQAVSVDDNNKPMKSKKEPENSRSKTTKTKITTSSTTEDKRKGRSIKTVQKTANATDIQSTSSESVTKPSVKISNFKNMESSCQTDTELLLRSTYLKDAFNQTIRQGLGEQIASRLTEMPLIVKKQFLLMMKTIQEQEAKISKYETAEEKYQQACSRLKEFGRSTRLEFSDSFRDIRADLVERKEEFKAHESEVAAILKREKNKYETFKSNLQQRYDDTKLENEALLAKVAYLEQDREYEKERADYFLYCKDVSEKAKNKATETAETAVKNLNDRLWLAENETCSRCKAVERMRKKMTEEVAQTTQKAEKACQERDEAQKDAKFFESVANKLGKDCDTIKYERESWKNQYEKIKREFDILAANLKEKEKELLQKSNEATLTPGSSTPRSVVCTPADAERITPPEDGELSRTPPHRSPHGIIPPLKTEKSLQKVVIQKAVEKKAPPPIASGFESWVPKEKLNEPAPKIPRSISAFGVPTKPQPKLESSNSTKYGPCSQPTPWEKATKITAAVTSNSLSEAMAKVEAESFVGGGCLPSYTSKSYKETLNQMTSTRKRVVEPSADKKVEHKNKSTPTDPTLPQVKKIKSEAPDQFSFVPVKSETPDFIPTLSAKSSGPCTKAISVSSKIPAPCTGVGSLSNLKKIPKLSEKPPQPEFAPALGMTEKVTASFEIPGLGMNKLDEETMEKRKDEITKIKAAVINPAVTSSQFTSAKSVTPQPKTTETSNVQIKNQQTEQGKANSHNNNHDTPKKINPISKSKQNKNHGTPKKKNKGGNRSEPSFNQHLPWQRPPNETTEKQWRQHPHQYGIQSNQQSFQMDIGFERSWSDSSSRNGLRPNDFRSANLLPWHRAAQDTPFGKVPIQDNFALGRPMSMQPQRFQTPQQHQSFYNTPRESSFFPSSRDFSPPQPPQQSRMFSSPPFGYSGPPNEERRNPRSFYS